MKALVTGIRHTVTPKSTARRVRVVERSHTVKPKGNGKGVILRKKRGTHLVRVSVDEGVRLRRYKDRFLLKVDT